MEGELEDGEQMEAFSRMLSMCISGWLRRGKMPVEPEENPGQSVIGHSLPGWPGEASSEECREDLASRERGYANEAVHRASNASEEFPSGREVGKT